MSIPPPRLCGLVLAAGAGTRFGGPKAFALTADGTPWVAIAADALRAAGCDRVVVALSEASSSAAELVPAHAEPLVVAGAAAGLSVTLRGALERIGVAGAVVILPVDTPGVVPEAIRRVVAAGRGSPEGLAQAVYGGRPGHPVLVGGAHVARLRATLSGDAGARPYLIAHDATAVECGDLWSGEDIDRRSSP
ncbi:nucleotidyltransferase family protein [Microbacterium marinilacus]|uniref:NTP transferase domain-containing protein n=1 Tax=Microbacterium marinilacus TaxID=415209 RepID=A0ABP7BG57_9MICO|nr:NTP transferase domain-containing protein [Microbacterium marinilacus]MBY0688943.1 NTP transferase domain-containing protein [Microbacterium marinilacus]